MIKKAIKTEQATTNCFRLTSKYNTDRSSILIFLFPMSMVKMIVTIINGIKKNNKFSMKKFKVWGGIKLLINAPL